MDNLLAAYDACESIRRAYVDWESQVGGRLGAFEGLYDVLDSEDFRGEAAATQHRNWLKRNKSKEWVLQEQKVAFDELKESDQDANRSIVHTACQVWKQHSVARAASAGPSRETERQSPAVLNQSRLARPPGHRFP